MIAKAIEKIVAMATPNIIEFNEESYTDKDLTRIDKCLRATPITMSNLTSLVGYIKSLTDAELSEKPYIVQVVSPEEVKLISALDKDKKRECIVDVKADIVSFPWNTFKPHEEFLINVQSKFIDDDETDKALVLKFAGTVKDGTVADYSDNGVSQKAVIKTGVTSVADAVVPSPCKLRPYRTFQEVEQPVSDFIFRMQSDKYNGVTCALIEADGKAWKSVAMKKVREYLEFKLADLGNFTVIS